MENRTARGGSTNGNSGEDRGRNSDGTADSNGEVRKDPSNGIDSYMCREAGEGDLPGYGPTTEDLRL